MCVQSQYLETEGIYDTPHDNPPRWAVMLSAYVDESGQQAKGLVIVAGFIGDKAAWEKCAIAWRDGLSATRRDSLHVVDLRFKREREKRLLERLGPIPKNCGLIPVSGSVNVSDYYDLVEESPSQIHASGYSMAIIPLILAIQSVIPENESYEVIFEEQTALGFYRDKLLQMISLIMDRDPQIKSGAKRKQLVSWRTMTKGQTHLFEPADYLSYHLAHHAAAPESVRAQWTRPILGSGKVHIKHLTREFTRDLFSIAPSLRLPNSEIELMKREIRLGKYDPWEEMYKERP
jgi:hypothetical protein